MAKPDSRIGQFVVAIDGKTKRLLRIEQIDGQTATGIDHRKYPADQTPRFEVNLDTIVAWLGNDPAPGSAYGVKVERYRRTLENPHFTGVHVWRDLKKAEWRFLEERFDAVKKRMKKLGVQYDHPVELHIKEQSGKYAGTYLTRGHQNLEDGEEPKPDIMTFMPETIDKDDPKTTDHLIGHEYGHGVFNRVLGPQARAAWVNLYLKFVESSVVSLKQIDEVRTAIEKERPLCVNDVYGLFDGDDAEMQVAVEQCLSHVMGAYNINKKYLDLLLNADKKITHMFPTHPIDVGDVKDMITEYAKKSPTELFCECFGIHVAGLKLPEVFQNLLDKSLRRL